MSSFQEIVGKTFSHLCMGKSRLGRKISEINKRVGDNIFEKKIRSAAQLLGRSE